VGLFRRRGGDDLVAAQAKVVAMGPTPKGARQTGKLDVEYEFTLALDGGRQVEHTCVVPHDRMPLLGDTLPVRLAESDVREIDFERVPSLAERAMASATAAQRGDQAGAARALGFTPRDGGGGDGDSGGPAGQPPS
jgi:hypothetical protein